MKRLQSPSGARILFDGREVINFGGSNYLGLAGVSDIAKMAAKTALRYGATAQLPRHYGFVLEPNLDVEETARGFFQTSGAMYFATGYLFGLIVLPALAGDYDVTILDESAHYCLFDGAKVAGREILTFEHLNPDDLARTVKKVTRAGRRALVATDGMTPTFGHTAPLADYAKIVEANGGWLVVDESHSFGVQGPSGRGALERDGLKPNGRIVAGGSMSKAFGAYGGLVLGDAEVIARCWRSPAALGAASGMSTGAAMSAAAMRYVERHPERLEQLRRNTDYLKTGLVGLGLDISQTDTPLATFVCGTANQMRALQADLFEAGLYVIYSEYVGAGPEGAIRCAVFADHKRADLDRLLIELSRRL